MLSATADQRCPIGLEGSYISATVAPSVAGDAEGPDPPALPATIRTRYVTMLEQALKSNHTCSIVFATGCSLLFLSRFKSLALWDTLGSGFNVQYYCILHVVTK